MHYHAEVWVPEKPKTKKEAENILGKILASYHEESRGSKGFYDFYQIGGRWTGAHDDYDPQSNPLNYYTCSLCRGSGTRTDMNCSHSRGCNGCDGTGMEIKWPTQWVFHENDIMAAEELEKRKPDFSIYTLVVAPTGKRKRPRIFHTEEWNPSAKTFDKTTFDGNPFSFLKSLNIKGGYLITLDYHS